MGGSRSQDLEMLIAAIPEGWSSVRIAGQSWGVTRTTRAAAKVVSIDAECLGTSERLGANIWMMSGSAILRPCEVPEETVMRFLNAAAAAYSK